MTTKIFSLPTLYSLSKSGKIQIWKVWTDGNLVCTRWGQKDGAKQTATFKAEPKNTGRANATTAKEQAIAEARALWEHRKARKYRESIEELKTSKPRLPMLAHRYEDHKKKLQWPVLVQKKFDGVRCLAVRDKNAVTLLSRQGKRYHVPHIEEQLLEVMLPGDVFDGELYLHGEPLQNIVSAVKKRGRLTPSLKYHVYDIAEWKRSDYTAQQEGRVELLKDRFYYGNEVENVVRVSGHLCQSHRDVDKWRVKFCRKGYEGAIVRDLRGEYVYNHRSHSLLKFKAWLDEEFEIVDVHDGKGKEEGCAIFTCRAKNDEPFDVRPKGTMVKRQKMFRQPKKYVGKMLTVKFQKYTVDGIPFHPVGLRVREEE